MAEALTLHDFPHHFGESLLSFTTTLRQRIHANMFANESYIQSVKLFGGYCGIIQVKATVLRSQRKNDVAHKVTMDVDAHQISLAY